MHMRTDLSVVRLNAIFASPDNRLWRVVGIESAGFPSSQNVRTALSTAAALEPDAGYLDLEFDDETVMLMRVRPWRIASWESWEDGSPVLTRTDLCPKCGNGSLRDDELGGPLLVCTESTCDFSFEPR